jgi:hypothetical protein
VLRDVGGGERRGCGGGGSRCSQRADAVAGQRLGRLILVVIVATPAGTVLGIEGHAGVETAHGLDHGCTALMPRDPGGQVVHGAIHR